MSTLLALDTATEACSVALLHDGKVTSHYEVIPRLHAQKLLPMIQQLLADAGTTLQAIDAIAFGRGPGAFTGVRIAIGVVQGLAFALDRPVLPVSNLAVLAQRALREHGATQVAAAIDAPVGVVAGGDKVADAERLHGPRRSGVADDAPVKVERAVDGGARVPVVRAADTHRVRRSRGREGRRSVDPADRAYRTTSPSHARACPGSS